MSATNWNYGDVWETVAELQPDAVAITQGDRNMSWEEFDRGADGIARYLLDLGVSQQDKVALYLYNSPEYLQSLFGAFKIGLVPINTNYRYADEELTYLWENADAVAVIFHGAFAQRIGHIRDRLPAIRGWLWIDDGSGPCRTGPPPTKTPPPRPQDGPPRHGVEAVTTCSCSTPGARRVCPRESCGDKTTSSSALSAVASAAIPNTAA